MTTTSPSSVTASTAESYSLGVALSGGGARGFAHVGALKAIEEFGLKPDIIAGVSAGSVIAVLYAAGLQSDDILKLFSDGSFRRYCDFSIRGGGIFRIDKFADTVATAIGKKYVNIEDLPLKLSIGATNLDKGAVAMFEEGPIIPAMTASCSIPILFQPVTINGDKFVDGGVLRNLPARNIRSRCCRLIGINCSPVEKGVVKPTLMEVGLRAYRLMSKANVAVDMSVCDLAIEIPEMSAYSTFNLKEIRQVYIRGYAATKRALRNSNFMTLATTEK